MVQVGCWFRWCITTLPVQMEVEHGPAGGSIRRWSRVRSDPSGSPVNRSGSIFRERRVESSVAFTQDLGLQLLQLLHSPTPQRGSSSGPSSSSSVLQLLNGLVWSSVFQGTRQRQGLQACHSGAGVACTPPRNKQDCNKTPQWVFKKNCHRGYRIKPASLQSSELRWVRFSQMGEPEALFQGLTLTLTSEKSTEVATNLVL